jgi:hypothetical protein
MLMALDSRPPDLDAQKADRGASRPMILFCYDSASDLDVSNSYPGSLTTLWCSEPILAVVLFTWFLTMGTFVPFPGPRDACGCASLEPWARTSVFPWPESEPNANETRGKNEEDFGRVLGFGAHD